MRTARLPASLSSDAGEVVIVDAGVPERPFLRSGRALVAVARRRRRDGRSPAPARCSSARRTTTAACARCRRRGPDPSESIGFSALIALLHGGAEADRRSGRLERERLARRRTRRPRPSRRRSSAATRWRQRVVDRSAVHRDAIERVVDARACRLVVDAQRERLAVSSPAPPGTRSSGSPCVVPVTPSAPSARSGRRDS